MAISNPNIAIDQLLAEVQARSYELCVQYGWTLSSVIRRPSHASVFAEEIEIVVQPPYGERSHRVVQVSLDTFYLNQGAISGIAREYIRELERDMAQWNQRQADRLREQEAQRRRAQGREDPPITFNSGMANTGTYQFNWDPGDVPALRQEAERLQNEYVLNQTSATQWVTDHMSINNTPYVTMTPGLGGTWQVSPNQTTIQMDQHNPPVTADMVKNILAEALRNLDIRISIDHSDGEVEVEIEVSYNGEVIASDSDHVSI
jgi:hypothetical protein